MMTLRPYQADTMEALNDYLRTRDDNPCIVVPTGGGKSIIIAAIAQYYQTTWPGTRICVTAHVKELVRQNVQKTIAIWNEADIGIYSAGMGYRQTKNDLIFASIQSIYRRAAELGHFDLIFVDEAHRIPIAGEGVYRRFISEAKEINPNLRVVGFTATPYRLGPGMVVGPDYILNGVAYDVSVRDLIEDGYLCRLKSKDTKAHADLTGVRTRGGDFKDDDLNDAVTQGDLVDRTVDEIVERCRDRKSWLIFCASIEHAEKVSESLLRYKINAPVVSSKTPRQDRDDRIKAHQEGRVLALCNVNVLSEGYDAPQIDAVILLRPTKSEGLYYQQVGRGLRLHDDKNDCLVLDFAGNIAQHGPIDAMNIDTSGPKGPKEKGEAPSKACPICDEIVFLTVMTCPDCGHVWVPIVKPKHEDKASDLAILSEPPVELAVTGIRYIEHLGGSGIPTLRVDYQCGLLVFREWKCLQHDGYARKIAAKWWAERMPPGTFAPETIKEAIRQIETGEAKPKVPSSIYVRVGGRKTTVTGYEWNAEGSQGSDIREATEVHRDSGINRMSLNSVRQVR